MDNPIQLLNFLQVYATHNFLFGLKFLKQGGESKVYIADYPNKNIVVKISLNKKDVLKLMEEFHQLEVLFDHTPSKEFIVEPFEEIVTFSLREKKQGLRSLLWT